MPNEGMFVEAFIRGLRAITFGESLVQRRPEDMAAINIRAASHIKAKEFTIKKLDEERRTEGPVVGIQPVCNRGGPLKGKREEQRFGGPYGGFKPVNEWRLGRSEWASPKLVASQEEIVKDVNTTRLLYFPEKTTKHMGGNKNVWCYFHKTYEQDTEDCYTLSRKIEGLLRQVLLKVFKAREGKEERQVEI